MIGRDLVHVGIGDTGEGMIRTAFYDHLIKEGRIEFINDDAHMTLAFARTLSDAPSFTFVRSPWDWYISWYIHELKEHRWQGTFRKWFYERDEGGVCFATYWHKFTDPGVDYVGKFENFKEDLIRIVPTIIPHIVTAEEVESWFPQIYRQWSNRTWLAAIEQWLRDELYTSDMIEKVYIQDAELIERFGYDFNQKYDVSEMRTGQAAPLPQSEKFIPESVVYSEILPEPPQQEEQAPEEEQ